MTKLETITGLGPITTITFDMDDTLWDFRSAMERALRTTLERLQAMAPGERTQSLTVQDMMNIRDGVALELGEGATRQEEIRYAAMAKTLEYVGIQDTKSADELFGIYMAARLADAKPYPEVPAVLETLKNRFQIGLISNGNNKPDSVGLPGIFDFTVFAHECGFPKPHARIFEFALARFEDNPSRVMHVGDSLVSDVHGANECGMLSVWLNRDGNINQTSIVPDWEIKDLNGLLGIL